MNDQATGRKFSSVISIIAIVISLGSAVFSFSTLYYGHLRDPHIVGSTGNYIYLQGRPRIGVPVSFFNDGARTGVINSGSLTLNDGPNKFHFFLTLFSPSTEKWIDEGGKLTSVPTTFSLFSQVAVKGGDSAEGVFWFSPQLADFKFQPDTNYSANLSFATKSIQGGNTDAYSPLTSLELCSVSAVFHIDTLTASNATQRPETPIPVPTGWPGSR